MPPTNNRKRQKAFRCLGFALSNFWTTMYYMRTKLGKITPKNFLWNAKQEFLCQSLESFSEEYYNIDNKILDFQFGPLCASQICSNCSVGSDQDEAEIQYDWWSTPEWYNWEKCEKISVKNACITKFSWLRHFI